MLLPSNAMPKAVLLFLAGISWLVFKDALPSLREILAVWLSLVLITVLFRRKVRIPFVFHALPAGFFWAAVAAWQVHDARISSALEGKPVEVTGVIASLPEQRTFGTRFLFVLRTVSGRPFNSTVKITWQKPSLPLHVGSVWRLQVRLKRVHGLSNPGGVNHAALRLAEGIAAEGTVLRSSRNQSCGHEFMTGWLDQMRERVKDRLNKVLPSMAASRWLMALALGERENIPAEDWEVLRRTGTNHLMAIAGLHLGFISGGVFFLVGMAWRRSARLCLRVPARVAAGWAALMAGLFYGALSGFLLPARRASLMLATGMLGLLLSRRVPAWQAWSLALWVILLISPLSVLTCGFWLSFGSVALIIYGVSGRIAPTGLWWKIGRVQWVTAMGLTPLSVWLFQQYSVVSLVANAITIPWTGFLLLPLVLMGSLAVGISESFSRILFWLAGWVLTGMWQVLAALSHLSFAAFPVVVTEPWRLLLMLGGILLLLAPVGFPCRWLGPLWLLPIFFWHLSPPEAGTFRLTLLDTGQGLSAVVQTAGHVLVFDAGPAFARGFDAGAEIVTPFLRSRGIRQIDSLVISHGDSDHAGGVSALLAAFRVPLLLTSVPERMPVTAFPCLRGRRWVWENVRFEFLYPDANDLLLGNESSCVLKVTGQNGQSVLLTGDIEKNAERKMLDRGEPLTSTVLVVPHHGSKTSSTEAFVLAVHPAYALFSAGYRNRYHFPHPAVEARYHAAGVTTLSTIESGAIQMLLGKGEVRLVTARQKETHFW